MDRWRTPTTLPVDFIHFTKNLTDRPSFHDLFTIKNNETIIIVKMTIMDSIVVSED